MPLDFPMTETDVNHDAFKRARYLKSLGHSISVIAVALRPYCSTQRERDDVLRLVYA